MLNNSEVSSFYLGKLKEHGPSSKGVGWKDDNAQEIRFRQLIKIIDTPDSFTINDLGCGTGEILRLLDKEFPNRYKYHGYDILEEMITNARQLFPEGPSIHFSQFDHYNQIRPADFTVASGIFNVKNSVSDEVWQAFIIETIQMMAKSSVKGFSFNALTKYSDRQFMRPDLYYSDPLLLFDYCKKNFSRNVALLHDYEIYDFTILVRK
ncbi:MAG TPA: class I SAM-dependent methyltransferase [Cyclobacteriaceae bacterium]|nr:class I SAM-dependent methyltransferase [Cyclobacteriaceae bacterium]